jgi:hypothetical protein
MMTKDEISDAVTALLEGINSTDARQMARLRIMATLVQARNYDAAMREMLSPGADPAEAARAERQAARIGAILRGGGS